MKEEQNIVIYKTKDGPELQVKLEKETLWFTQAQIAILFDVQKAAVSKHIKNIFDSGELNEEATVSKMETVQIEGNRKIKTGITSFL
ncbi:death-on-curing protein [Calditerrivibrio nitroreducens]|uniref:Death-on-curing family protein n=1 Tax=Calditerrivibrio nitroreducens (strain DSM 19672 / NBRC 101217 / Yu37-1) TaxID=768670 RepID=E4TK34_CALNY|nr:death-on-curing protein [Calditerrivibrio nitroreducens]ADR19310.1 death-on-curing family protein [Calditerrivibrio nitroreducens DSM 19672]